MNRKNQPPQKQVDRDSAGMLQPGHGVGQATRFQPGHSGNPGGLPPGSVKPGVWLKTLGDVTDDKLRDIVGDHRASRSKRAAAQMWLDTAGKDPHVRRNAYRVVSERIEGKPSVAVKLEESTQSPKELMARLKALVSQNPRIAGLLIQNTPYISDRVRAMLPGQNDNVEAS